MNLDILKCNDLLDDYGSPLYVYDYDALKNCCLKMYNFKQKLEEKIKKEVTIHYSQKANTNPAILKVVKECNLSVDSMSPFELDVAKKCGFKQDQILYVCNNIDDSEMKMVHDNNILICLDSISQVKSWGKLFPNTQIMVRINPGTLGVGHSKKVITSGKATKFGISEDNISELLKTAEKYNLNIIGVHQHLGSLFLNDKIDDYIMGVEAGINIIKKHFKELKIIDLGGGFGVPYTPNEIELNLNEVASRLEDILIPFISEYPSVEEFKFEPGRFIPCQSGVLIGKVTAVKFENEKWWVGTDIGMNELVRPSMYDSYHEIKILSNKKSKKIIANICGNICESGDILAKEREISLPQVGDIILVYNAGAYGYAMASNYTGRPRPAEIMINNDNIKLIRKRETIEYMEANIIWDNK